ncbi:16S rRNA (guanine(527)-N(7))-methyltransferase RsmG [Raineya orbicola]|uniref:Ribosomal RNA small subunit methyltransferase G n=1 Tax=Raineya orbicola TaxID=2016530 RepID=A0A2N3IIY1_9BACT|nr:16S rRNA (guanine(527)-N(7))-methyltransferase RsmG [Raineya orbicola]PKQ70274.1 gidB: 16S rRNA (guanine(527)-N(7))-methyltransferase GidB [Raineya orbicola]
MSVALIEKYFPNLSEKQKQRFEALLPLYQNWNAKINVISRKDMDEFYTHHVLHSLGIAKIIMFEPMTMVLDVGTGGGFPGIPLAILQEKVEFHLIDSIGKKIKVVEGVAKELGLENVQYRQIRAEQVENNMYDFVLSRAVTQADVFGEWVKNKFSKNQYNKLPNGILHLKGGDLTEELAKIKRKYKIFNLSDFFQEPFFETKKVVYIPRF